VIEGAHAEDVPMVEIARYPALRLLTWQMHQDLIREDEAFSIYEREWRHVDAERLTQAERELVGRLARRYGRGLLNV
jgi:hypothetical protein